MLAEPNTTKPFRHFFALFAGVFADIVGCLPSFDQIFSCHVSKTCMCCTVFEPYPRRLERDNVKLSDPNTVRVYLHKSGIVPLSIFTLHRFTYVVPHVRENH